MKIYVASVEALKVWGKKKRQDETSLGPSYFVPSYVFDALLCRNWPFSPFSVPDRIQNQAETLAERWTAEEVPIILVLGKAFVSFHMT